MKRPVGDLVLGILVALLIWGGIVVGGMAVVVVAWKMIGGLR